MVVSKNLCIKTDELSARLHWGRCYDLMPQGKIKEHVVASIQDHPSDAHLYLCPSHIESS